MPSRGGEARSYQLATLGKVAHESFISDEIGSLLEELRSYEESLDYDSLDASLIRVARRDYEKAVRVPPELSAEITRVGAAVPSASGSRRARTPTTRPSARGSSSSSSSSTGTSSATRRATSCTTRCSTTTSRA